MSIANKKQNEFSCLSTIDTIKEFLEKKGRGHTLFYHYTTLDTLKGMMESRKLHLTRMDKLNDALECAAAEDRKKRVYIVSFSFGAAESMAMWSMYSAPFKKGIRLTIPKRAITRTLNDFVQNKTRIIYSTETGKELPIGETTTLKMMDVVYAHSGSLEHNKEKLLDNQIVNNAKQAPELAFCVKNEIWLSENETRMVLELDKELPGDVEKVAIDFDYAVNNLKVTGSPCISSAELEKELRGLGKDKMLQSIAYNQVFFKDCKCERQTDFCKKNK